MTRNQSFPLDIGWQLILKDLGFQPAHVLRRAGLPQDLLSRPGQSLSTTQYLCFWQSLEDEAADPLFALRIIESVSAESFNPPVFAALCSANLMQAVQRLAKYKQLVAPMSLDIEVASNGDLRLSPRWLLAQGDIPYSLQVAELAFFVRLVRLATREPVNALGVTLPALPRRPCPPVRKFLRGARATRRQPEHPLRRGRCPAPLPDPQRRNVAGLRARPASTPE